VVGKFVEFYGPGLAHLSIPDRATISNMAPEQGSTVSFFPIDDETLKYMRLTGRSPEQIELTERYAKETGAISHRQYAGPRVYPTHGSRSRRN